MLQVFCATLIMTMALVETTVLIQWGRQSDLPAPGIEATARGPIATPILVVVHN